MKARLNLVVTCAERKVSQPVDKMTLGDLSDCSVSVRCARWIKRLSKSEEAKVPARDLYKGNHWHIVRSIIEDVSPKIDLTLWIASAGYGLIRDTARIGAYSATFAAGFRDSVGDANETEQWWYELSKWRGPSTRGPRSLAALAAQNAKTPLIVVASASYIRAMTPDLLKAGEILSPRRLGIISAGMHSKGALRRFEVPVDARFQQLVGGQMQALNVRVAHRALTRSTKWMKDIARLRKKVMRQAATLQPLDDKHRNRKSDDQLLEYIRRERKKTPNAGHSVLLRRLRADGIACEQARFKRLCRAGSARVR